MSAGCPRGTASSIFAVVPGAAVRGPKLCFHTRPNMGKAGKLHGLICV